MIICFCIVLLQLKDWLAILTTLEVVFCLPEKIDDWPMEVLHGRFFGGKEKVVGKCATKHLLWDFWRKRISRCLKISLFLVVLSEFYSNTMPLDGLQIIQISFVVTAFLGWFCGERQSLPIALRFLLGSVEVYTLSFLIKEIITITEWK